MKQLFKVVVLFVVLGVAACMPTRESAETRSAINSVTIQDVVIEVDPNVYTGLPALDGKTPQEQLRDYTSALTYALKSQVIGKPGGPTPAKLVIKLHQVDLASGVGRVVGGNGSAVSGRAMIVELKNPKRLIVESPTLVAQEGSISGSGNIGVFVALAVKVVDAASEARAERMARYFADSVRNWLVPSK